MLDEILRRLGWYRRPNQYVDRIEVRQFTIKDGSITPPPYYSSSFFFRVRFGFSTTSSISGMRLRF